MQEHDQNLTPNSNKGSEKQTLSKIINIYNPSFSWGSYVRRTNVLVLKKL